SPGARRRPASGPRPPACTPRSSRPCWGRPPVTPAPRRRALLPQSWTTTGARLAGGFPRPAGRPPEAAEGCISLESMAESPDHAGLAPSEQQEAVVAHDQGTLLVLGAAGTGRTEALAQRLGRLVGEGRRPLVLTCSVAAANRIRARAEETIETGYEEL